MSKPISKDITRRSFVATAAISAALVGTACTSDNTSTGDASTGDAASSQETEATTPAENTLSPMTLEQKIAQMIMPAIRTWGGEDNGVTELSAASGLAEVLRRRQYCGVILFGQNVQDTEQTVRLIHDLQANNAQSDDAGSSGLIPYFVAADQEGGSVARLSMGTRGTGSMAIGATKDAAEDNALATGQVFGQELSALGINVNLAPCIDVIRDLADLGMSTRVFSNNSVTVGRLGMAFARGVGESGVVTCFKHFPGAGDGSDWPTAIHLTREELDEQGLVPFSVAVDSGAKMIMIAATTFPDLDDEQVLADGKTRGFYPATMSPKIVGEMLRGELGFEGVVITDALEMDQFYEEPDTGDKILPGEKYSVEAAINIAQKCIEAGCDILLIPRDFKDESTAAWYDEYISGIVSLVESGALSEKRIDESVGRILALKRESGVMDLRPLGGSVDDDVDAAKEVVGSDEHHDIERSIAEQAVTLLKNDGALPVPLNDAHVVILGRAVADAMPIEYALSKLVLMGALSTDARIDNRLTGHVGGSADSTLRLTVDCYYDLNNGALMWSDELSAAIADAGYVVCLSNLPAGIDALQDSDPRVQGVTRALREAHKAGAKFVLLSDNIPADAARYPEADAIVCAYLSAGFDVDPTTGSGSENMRAINANVPAALCAIFGEGDMPGALPIDVYALAQDADGKWAYTDEVLYARGSGA